MGQYNKLTDTILLDKDSPVDRILHELSHSVGADEVEAQDLQQMYLQLLDKNIIKS